MWGKLSDIVANQAAVSHKTSGHILGRRMALAYILELLIASVCPLGCSAELRPSSSSTAQLRRRWLYPLASLAVPFLLLSFFVSSFWQYFILLHVCLFLCPSFCLALSLIPSLSLSFSLLLFAAPVHVSISELFRLLKRKSACTRTFAQTRAHTNTHAGTVVFQRGAPEMLLNIAWASMLRGDNTFDLFLCYR